MNDRVTFNWVYGSKSLNAAAAVDKGGGLVGIPVTAHGFPDYASVSISGTLYYDGSYTVDPTSSDNEVVIAKSYTAETFSASDTIEGYNRNAVFPVDYIMEDYDVVTDKFESIDGSRLDEYRGIRKIITLKFGWIANYTSHPTGTSTEYDEIIDSNTNFIDLNVDTGDKDGLGDPVALFKNNNGDYIGTKNIKSVDPLFPNVLTVSNGFTFYPDPTYIYYIGLPLLMDFAMNSGNKEIVYRTANISKDRRYKVKNTIDALKTGQVGNVDWLRKKVEFTVQTKELYTDLLSLDGI